MLEQNGQFVYLSASTNSIVLKFLNDSNKRVWYVCDEKLVALIIVYKALKLWMVLDVWLQVLEPGLEESWFPYRWGRSECDRKILRILRADGSQPSAAETVCSFRVRHEVFCGFTIHLHSSVSHPRVCRWNVHVPAERKTGDQCWTEADRSPENLYWPRVGEAGWHQTVSDVTTRGFLIKEEMYWFPNVFLKNPYELKG